MNWYFGSTENEGFHVPNRSRITSFTNDGLTFDVTDVGPLDGEVVICLHGFPQPASSWDMVSQQLTDNGFRVLAPTQRGYCHHARSVVVTTPSTSSPVTWWR